jgi:hypothetical protein
MRQRGKRLRFSGGSLGLKGGKHLTVRGTEMETVRCQALGTETDEVLGAWHVRVGKWQNSDG